MANELYERLGVAPAASDEEIKKAYFRMVRQHPPEKDPDGFKRLREAYDTLRDVKARRSYDAAQAHGEEIGLRLSRAMKLKEEESWNAAAEELKRILLLDPELDFAYNQLAICLAEQEKFEEAAEVFERLLKRTQDVAVFWANYGDVRIEQAMGLESSDPKERALFAEAKRLLTKAHLLERHNAAPLRSLARIASLSHDYAEAERLLEEAINADGKVDFGDLDIFLELCLVYSLQGRYDRLPGLARRIEAVRPDDDEARKYIVARFASAGVAHFKARNYQLAEGLLDVARKFAPGDPELRKAHETAQRAARICREFSALEDDQHIIPPVRILARVVGVNFLDEWTDGEAEYRAVVGRAVEAFDNYPVASVVASLTHLKNQYPGHYEVGSENYDSFLARGRAALQRPSSGSSNCFVATATFGTPWAPEVVALRGWRDDVLRRSVGGRAFIRVYYVVGPYLAALVRRCPPLKRVSAELLGRFSRAVAQRDGEPTRGEGGA